MPSSRRFIRIAPGIAQVRPALVDAITLDVAELGALLVDPFVAALLLEARPQRVVQR